MQYFLIAFIALDLMNPKYFRSVIIVSQILFKRSIRTAPQVIGRARPNISPVLHVFQGPWEQANALGNLFNGNSESFQQQGMT